MRVSCRPYDFYLNTSASNILRTGQSFTWLKTDTEFRKCNIDIILSPNNQSTFKFHQLFHYCLFITIFFSSLGSSQELYTAFSYHVKDFLKWCAASLQIYFTGKYLIWFLRMNQFFSQIWQFFFVFSLYTSVLIHLSKIRNWEFFIKIVLVVSKNLNPGKKKEKVCPLLNFSPWQPMDFFLSFSRMSYKNNQTMCSFLSLNIIHMTIWDWSVLLYVSVVHHDQSSTLYNSESLTHFEV